MNHMILGDIFLLGHQTYLEDCCRLDIFGLMETRSRNGYLEQTVSGYMQRPHYPFCEVEEMPFECQELLILAGMEADELIDRKEDAEREKDRLLSRLCIANDEAEAMALKIEEANAKAAAYGLKLLPTCPPSDDEQEFMILSLEIHRRCAEALRELDDVKRQICSLKLDMASALEQKSKAQMEIEFWNAKLQSYSGYREELRRQIQEANVEQEFIDLARVEAETELKHINALSEAESAHFTERMEKARSRVIDLRRQIASSKKMQTKLLITVSDANALQNEMELIGAMEKAIRQANSVDDSVKVQEIDTFALQAAKAELEKAKKELLSLKKQGFKLMDEMDASRKELVQIVQEKQQSVKTKKDSDSILENLNMELYKAMSKMESASMAEKRADAIIATLSTALQQVQSDADAAKREADMIAEEAKAVQMETEKTKLRTESVKKKFEEAMRVLKTVKASEANALEVLKAITESTMNDRAISSLWSSTINISKFEYYYLIKQAKATQEVAEKKVEAAQAWMEALEGESKEKDNKDKSDRNRENWAIVAVQEKEISKPKIAALVSKKKAIKNEVNHHYEPEREYKYDLQCHDSKLAIAMPRRSLTVSGVSGTSRRLHARKLSNPSRGQMSFTCSAPTSQVSKKKGKILENIAKFLKGRRCQQQQVQFAVSSEISVRA